MGFVAFCCLVVCLVSPGADPPKATQLSPEERKEYEFVQKRLHDHEPLLTAAGWTLAHAADEKEVKQVEQTLNLLAAFTDSRQIPKLAEAGGLKSFKANTALLLTNKDPVVRGFGAVFLGVIGDRGYASDIARLLEDKGPPPSREEQGLYNWDRSRAATALGLLGAREYATNLALLLRSSDSVDRTGAALGLGFMGAKQYANDIAGLLTDDKDQAQTAAMYALAELDAVEAAEEIARLLTSQGDPSVSETASYALVRLNAKEQAGELAGLLQVEYRKGYAAKALALLGAKEYTKEIARLIEDNEPLVRCEALIALGILDAKEKVESVAAHLHDEQSYVRPYAAVSLLLLGDETHSREIVEVVADGRGPEILSDGWDSATYFKAYIKLHPMLAERKSQLIMRAKKGWDRLNRSRNDRQLIRPETNQTPPEPGRRR